MKILAIFCGLLLVNSQLVAQVYEGTSGQQSNMQSILDDINPGSVVVLSEYHDNETHHARQLSLIAEIAKRNPLTPISVGMEFFYIDQREHVRSYMANEISEEEFLQAIGWGGFSFDFYRDIVRFPKRFGNGTTIALNSPRWLTRKVSRQGFESLTDEDLQWVPANFELGNDDYFERFSNVLGGGHVPADKMERYFTAQSLWDDTMANSASEFMANNPEHIFVIIIGDFHVAYGGGTPDRLGVRGVSDIVTVSQIDVAGLSSEEIEELVQPHPKYGKRADYVWLSGSEQE